MTPEKTQVSDHVTRDLHLSVWIHNRQNDSTAETWLDVPRRSSKSPSHQNTAMPQHRATARTLHHETLTPQHRAPVVVLNSTTTRERGFGPSIAQGRHHFVVKQQLGRCGLMEEEPLSRGEGRALSPSPATSSVDKPVRRGSRCCGGARIHRDAYDLIDWYGLLEKVETCWDVCTVSWARWNWPAAAVDAGASNNEVPENFLNNGHFQGQAQTDPGLDSLLSKTGGEEASLMLSATSGPGHLEEMDTVRSARVVLSVESRQMSGRGMGGLRTTRGESAYRVALRSLRTIEETF